MTTYNIAGVTYNQDMVPIAFDESYTGPNNALAGSVVASNETEYGLYTTSNGIGTELRTEFEYTISLRRLIMDILTPLVPKSNPP